MQYGISTYCCSIHEAANQFAQCLIDEDSRFDMRSAPDEMPIYTSAGCFEDRVEDDIIQDWRDAHSIHMLCREQSRSLIVRWPYSTFMQEHPLLKLPTLRLRVLHHSNLCSLNIISRLYTGKESVRSLSGLSHSA